MRLVQHRREVERALRHPEWQRTTRRRRMSLLGAVVMVALVAIGSRPEVRHCDMFSSAEQAQDHLRQHPDQVAWLDVDGDGLACA